MSLPTAEEVTNKYLYGSINRPSDLLDQSIIDHKNSNTPNEIKINAVEYMASGPGKFVNAANFDLVKQFFDLSNSIPPGTYTKTDVLKMFGYLDPVTGNAIQGMYAGYAVNQIYLGTNEPDYAERAYIWGTTGFKINDDPIFVVDISGNREVRNFYIEPAGDEDFDFEGGPASKRGNEALEPVIDPSGIGRTVKLKFEDKNKIPTSTLTMSSFVNDVDNCIDVDVIDKTLTAIPAVYAIEELENKLFNTGDQSTRFLDDDDRPIIYGTNDDDVIDGTVTLHKTAAYKTPVDLYVKEYKLGGLGVISTLGLDSNLYPYLKNGIAYIAGRGDDFVNGTMKSDAIYGGQGSDTLDGKIGADKMYGGTEDDTYIVDDENDEVIEYENEGDDRVESSITYSLTENVESLILTETDHIDGTGNSLDNYIFGNDGNNTLNGEAGNDDILGYLGDDTLYGGDNDDYLTGGEGDDVLYGGSDNDVLYGEDGYFLPPLQRHLVERLTER
jgi:Ca2+-binding RTX toxin-like protein